MNDKEEETMQTLLHNVIDFIQLVCSCTMVTEISLWPTLSLGASAMS